MKITHYVWWWVQEARPEGTIGGSYHIIDVLAEGKSYKILMDIGNQPSNAAATQMQNPFEHMDVDNIDITFVSHVHQDHIGNCLRLVKAGYKWPIYMSEMSKFLAKVIFDDALKHEKEEVEEYNRKIERLQQELKEARYTMRADQQAPETRHMSHPHSKWGSRFFSINSMFEGKINDILWDYAIKKTKYRKRLKEILLDASIDEKELLGIIHEIPVHKNQNHENFIDDAIALKREIIHSQHNFHGLAHEDAKHKLQRYGIKDKDDIYALNDRLAVMEFDENDIIQTLNQIIALPLHEKTAIIPGVIDLTFYSAGHIEGAVQSVWTVHEWDMQKTFMYTGDIGRSKQPSLTGKPDMPKETMDYVITEGTYAGRTHNDRLWEVHKIIHDIAEAKDTCLIPVFALQRMQDVLSVIVEAVHNGKLQLWKDEKIYCHSPLGYHITKEYLLHDTHGSYTNCSDRETIQWIERPEEIKKILLKPGRKIIMCSWWMLERWTITQYIDAVHINPDARIILTWFQVPGTNGYKILHGEFEEPVYLNNKVIRENKAYIGNYPLSGHADHDELKSHLTTLHYAPHAQVTMVHGWPARHILAKDVQAVLPNLTINVPDENGITFAM